MQDAVRLSPELESLNKTRDLCTQRPSLPVQPPIRNLKTKMQFLLWFTYTGYGALRTMRCALYGLYGSDNRPNNSINCYE